MNFKFLPKASLWRIVSYEKFKIKHHSYKQGQDRDSLGGIGMIL